MENGKLIEAKVSNKSLHTDEEMTPEILKEFPGCEHFTDDQAREVVTTIKLLAELLYNLALPKELHNVDYHVNNSEDIGLDDEEKMSNLNRAA